MMEIGFMTISLMKKEDWNEPHIMTSAGFEEKQFERSWRQVMIPSEDGRELAELRTEEVFRLPELMTEEEFEEWHESSPELLEEKLERIREAYDIEGEEQ